jgi:hypothetical protein
LARFVSDSLPDDALALLRPENLEEKQNRVVQMITVDEEGWANAGMLSYADVIAKDGSNLDLATWGDGECATDLRRNGRITLLVIDEDMAYYVKGRAREVQATGDALTDVNDDGGHSTLAYFHITVQGVFEDRVPTAKVLGGVTFEGSESEQVAHDAILKKLASI